MAKTCAWCFKKTNLPDVFAAEAPLMIFMEDRINKWCEEHNITRDELWGGESDWNKIDLDPAMKYLIEYNWGTNDKYNESVTIETDNIEYTCEQMGRHRNNIEFTKIKLLDE